MPNQATIREWQAFTFVGESWERGDAIQAAADRYTAWLNAQHVGEEPTIWQDRDGLPIVREYPVLLTHYETDTDAGWDCHLLVLAYLRLPVVTVEGQP